MIPMSTTFLPEPWVGWRNGVIVAYYPNRTVAERDLEARKVDSTSPAPQHGPFLPVGFLPRPEARS
jgi:hypothetical protein